LEKFLALFRDSDKPRVKSNLALFRDSGKSQAKLNLALFREPPMSIEIAFGFVSGIRDFRVWLS